MIISFITLLKNSQLQFTSVDSKKKIEKLHGVDVLGKQYNKTKFQ